MQAALDATKDRFDRIVLLGGGNDCDDKYNDTSADASDILAKFKDLISSAKLLADNVIVSSICPRKRSDEVTQRIANVNVGLKVICEDMGVTFVNNDDVFYLRDGTLNDGFLLPDDVHLTPAATNRLVERLGLTLRQGCENAYTDHRRRNPKPKQKASQTHNQGTDTDLSHAFWTHSWKKVERRTGPNRRQSSNGGPSRTYPAPAGAQRVPQSTHPTRQATPQHRQAPRSYADASRRTSETVPPHTNSRGGQSTMRSGRNTPPPVRAQPEQHLSCQLCLGAGHTAVTCRARDTTCYSCHAIGHLSHACPNP